jgi:hypothetical protein
VLLELFHVSANQHLAQLDKVTVFLVVHLNDAPWVATAADLATLGVGNLVVGSNNSERNLGHDFLVLGDRLLVIELVAGSLEDLNGVVLDVGEDLKTLESPGWLV